MNTYDDIAEWYDQWVGMHSMRDDPFFQAVEALMGEVDGQRICDLACGQGRVARYLSDLGAHIVGIDISTKLLAIARRYEESQPRGIEYLEADVQHIDTEAVGLFDGVVCFIALMDIPNLTPTLRNVELILRPSGWFIFSILHPCFHTSQSGEIETPQGVVRTIRSYFVEGHWRSDVRPGLPGKVGSYHRTLSTYVNALVDAKLEVMHLSEPQTSVGNADPPSLSGLSRAVWGEVPTILVVKCRKPKQST